MQFTTGSPGTAAYVSAGVVPVLVALPVKKQNAQASASAEAYFSSGTLVSTEVLNKVVANSSPLPMSMASDSVMGATTASAVLVLVSDHISVTIFGVCNADCGI